MNKIKKTFLLIFTLLGIASTVAFASDDSKEKYVINLNMENFQQKVYNLDEINGRLQYLGDKPCIIDFYADWCGPCRKMAPILEKLAEEYDGQIYVYKIDIEKEKALGAVFGIKSLPTLLYIPMKGEPRVSIGATTQENLKKAITEFLLEK